LRFGRAARTDARLQKMELAPLIVGYELTDRGVLAIFAWIDIAIVDATNGVRLALLPSTLLFTVSLN
jgi:hypothetical protein